MGDILFFAILAGFIFFKLRATLGKRDGSAPSARPPGSVLGGFAKPKNDGTIIDVTPLKKTETAVPEPKEPENLTAEMKAQIAKIKEKDAGFSAARFLSGASTAYEMVITALNDGDKDTLQDLLDTENLNAFEAEIERRKASGNEYKTTLVAIVSSDIKEITLVKNMAEITVDFVSEQTSVVKDKEGKIVEGNPSRVSRITDSWVFRRDITSRDPNWTIIAT
ncbi:MAG: Tim44 domain-containing protein [Proteobacteria bacterium]|nr:Tim44 domain-containing protein [Pseudomonadota bacterium]